MFVVAQIVRLVRRIAEIYGGRPGLLGFIKLARSIGAHIAITGGMAVGDSLLQQSSATGSPRASRRAWAKACSTACSPRAWAIRARRLPPGALRGHKAPGVSDVAPFLFSGGKGE